jgi:plasmid stability protein
LLAFWYSGQVKTTIELPDDLIREIKVRAAREDRKLKDLIADLLRRGLAANESSRDVRHRVKLPLIHGQPPDPGEEVTPERMKQILLDEEVARYSSR